MRLCEMLILGMMLLGCGSEGVDEHPDADTDDGECTPMTADSHCNALDQCGCELGDWCCFMIHSRDGATCTDYGATCCAGEPGTLNAGQECPFPPDVSHGPYCGPGTVCLPEVGSSTATCRKLCRTTSECSSGECIPGPDVLVPDDYPGCEGGSTIPMHYLICS